MTEETDHRCGGGAKGREAGKCCNVWGGEGRGGDTGDGRGTRGGKGGRDRERGEEKGCG